MAVFPAIPLRVQGGELIRKALDDYAKGEALRGDGVSKTVETNRTRAPQPLWPPCLCELMIVRT